MAYRNGFDVAGPAEQAVVPTHFVKVCEGEGRGRFGGGYVVMAFGRGRAAIVVCRCWRLKLFAVNDGWSRQVCCTGFNHSIAPSIFFNTA
jgi:hypothetical protein